MPVDLILTSDGSHSLFNPDLNETYHSVHGAITESVHVFINSGLKYWSAGIRREVKVLEVGFGTGLNALLALQFAIESDVRTNYTTLEPNPLDLSIIKKLNYGEKLHDNGSLLRIHEADWGRAVMINDHFILRKERTQIQNWNLPAEKFDVIFFDAFAPSRQPEMWDIAVLNRIHNVMSTEGILVTYCARGQLKRDLKSIGMHVETLAGPPGKKEMVRALKLIR